MIHFFGTSTGKYYAVQSHGNLSNTEIEKLHWLFNSDPKSSQLNEESATIQSSYLGPRATMVTPWSTNAVEITQNMGISTIKRIEEFLPFDSANVYDKMLFQKYDGLDQNIFTIKYSPQAITEIDDIAAYNRSEGLSLSDEEVHYLITLSSKLGRKLTDSEVFGFSQVNSEHCRHKIFNGTFIIDGEEKSSSLFKLIKKTSAEHPNEIVSAYKDNVAFINGPEATQFAPELGDQPSSYCEKQFESVLSLKAETHNFPTTVEPFNGAATGSGGEIRDRLAGGQGSIPLAGTAVYMTAYSRIQNDYKPAMKERPWLYQTPIDILIKASNGASDFGNKFGQPLICGSLLTFEHEENDRSLGYDKVIMLAGGIGYGKKDQSKKISPAVDDAIVVMGGDNYRIGMGGAAVSSADTGAFGSGIELNAIQRSNPEMQKRVANAVRSMVESDVNKIKSIHDHGAGGHLNCLSELVEDTGGLINLDQLPVGDPTLSAKEIIGNESQERMGLVMDKEDFDLLKKIAHRERAPIYEVGKITGDKKFIIESLTSKSKPMDLGLNDLFGSSPKFVMKDRNISRTYAPLTYTSQSIYTYLKQVLQLEAVACKDWLTNKVDRCVGGRVAKQQCCGPLQLPLNNVGVMAIDYVSHKGIATSIGHHPIAALIDEAAGSRNAIAESLSNLVFAPLEKGLASVSLSANWMWPCKNEGEDARLYSAVEACSDFAISLGINIPTGKDSLSMKQKYSNQEVIAPGTVIISAIGQCSDVRRVIEPVLQKNTSSIYYINLSCDELKLGGSSFAQILNKIGNQCPDVVNPSAFAAAFNTIQQAIKEDMIYAGHDIGSGGLITTLLEMCFADPHLGIDIDLTSLGVEDSTVALFNENISVILQAKESIEELFINKSITYHKIGFVNENGTVNIKNHSDVFTYNVAEMRDVWFHTSFLLDEKQTQNHKAKERFDHYKNHALKYKFPSDFDGKKPNRMPTNVRRPVAAIIREKGSNSEREMANALYMAGFEVRDVHMTDLIYGRETLEDVHFIGAVGGFSNSDVLGSAKGWAGAFLYNEKANKALKNFYARPDTLSIGICNGCQLFMELELINPEHEVHGKMHHNSSGRFECTFTSVTIQNNHSVMLGSLAGQTLGIWSAHGEGKFALPYSEENYHVVAKFGYETYPANPNGSDYNIAMMSDDTGRHLVTMPHFERSLFPWNWGYYPQDRWHHEVSPWLEAFVNARKFFEGKVEENVFD